MSDLNKFDLEKEQKRVRSLLKTEEGKQAMRDVLGIQFVGDNPEDQPKDERPIVAMLLPSHYVPKPETTQAFLHMSEMSRDLVRIHPQPGVQSSVVHWVRNELLMRLYKSGQPFDYVLFMDDDIVPPDTALITLLNHKKDIIAGACTVRHDPPLPNFRIYDEEAMCYKTIFEWSQEGLLEVGAVGTGFMLIAKQVLDDVGEYYLSCTHEKKYFGMSDHVAEEVSLNRRQHAVRTYNKYWFEFLKQPNGQGEFGEDISFCFKAKSLGYKIFVDTTVRCGHVGNYAYGIDDYLFYQKQVLEQEELRKEIQSPIIGPDEVAVEEVACP